MLKHISLILLAFLPFFGLCQGSVKISGEFIEKVNGKDSVIFLSPFDDSAYYEKTMFSSAIKDGGFTINGDFSYPQMYRVRLKSETDKILYRSGFYFIDKSASSVVIGGDGKDGTVNGETGAEFRQKFVPYFAVPISGPNSINAIVYSEDQSFDLKLRSYVTQFPNSYVALWFLIIRFNNDGYSVIRNETLDAFSKGVKSGKLWKVLKTEFQEIRIKENYRFPKLLLQDTSFNEKFVEIPKSRYTLVDFWFSRCRPCLAQFPQLKDMYEKYHDQGFNVISLSTDVTKNVLPYWKKRITENELPWKNYLDENAKEATREKIFSFPTNFLLDENGKVIQKNISLDDLSKLLALHLAKNPATF